MSDVVHLGYEVGTGTAVRVPVLNLAVTGQTQQSGKTTTLEALVSRAKHTALTFVTKRGERAFADGRRVQPYFRDRADWQFVTSIIDATLQEKNKFLRPWIMKICRTTRSLAEVQTEVRKALKTAKGLNEGVYTQLDAYLDLIVPEIRRAKLAPALDLKKGINVMDISGSSLPMQMLFVQSALDWVNENEESTIVVVPEAWEFIPEGKGSPVKSSAVSLVRKGSGIGNRIWVDSQDMAGVDKVILRGCPVWLIGVQREANEIKRNLANIPKGIKRPTAAAIAQLERGQFYACWESHAIKTYVQPAWMDADEAKAHAMGVSVAPSRRSAPPVAKHTIEDDTVNEAEAQRLRDENAELRRLVDELRSQRPTGSDRDVAREFTVAETFDNERVYQAFKARLINEAPGILRVLTIKPELVVEVERKTVTTDGATLKGRVVKLLATGFFKEKKRHTDVKKELERTGPSVHGGNLSREFTALVNDGFLTDEGDGYVAVPGMKSQIIER